MAATGDKLSASATGAIPALHVALTVCSLVNDGVLREADAQKVRSGCRSLAAAIEAACGARAPAVSRLLPPSLLDDSLWQRRGWTVGLRVHLQNDLWRPLACAAPPCAGGSNLSGGLHRSESPFLASGTCPAGVCADPVIALFRGRRSSSASECSACPDLRVDLPRVVRSSRLVRRVGWHRVLTVVVPARPRLSDVPHGTSKGIEAARAELGAARRRWELLVRSLCERGFVLAGSRWSFAQARWGAMEAVFVAHRDSAGRFADAGAVRQWHIPPEAGNAMLLSSPCLTSARLDLLVSSTTAVARAIAPALPELPSSRRMLPYRQSTPLARARTGWLACCSERSTGSSAVNARSQLRLVWEEDAVGGQSASAPCHPDSPGASASAGGASETEAAPKSGPVLSDGCGAIPVWLGRAAAASEAVVRPSSRKSKGAAPALAWTPAAVQARFGGCKGLWIVSPVLAPDVILCRPSQQKIALSFPSAEQLDFEVLRAIGGALQPAEAAAPWSSHQPPPRLRDRRSRCRGRLSEQSCGLLLSRGVPVERLATLAAETAAVGAAALAGGIGAISALLDGRAPHDDVDWLSAGAEGRDAAVVRALLPTHGHSSLLAGLEATGSKPSLAQAMPSKGMPAGCAGLEPKAAIVASLLAEAGQRAAATLRSDARESLRIPLPLSRRLTLVPDPSGVLRPGEAFVRLSAASLATLRDDCAVWWGSVPAGGGQAPASGAGGADRPRLAPLDSRCSVLISPDGVLRGDVFAIRSPAHLPRHVVGLRCVSMVEAAARCAEKDGRLPDLAEALLWRDMLVDVLVLAADTFRTDPSDASRLSGGDFDGDEALVVFDRRLVEPIYAPLVAEKLPLVDEVTTFLSPETPSSKLSEPVPAACSGAGGDVEPSASQEGPDVSVLVRRWITSITDELPSLGRASRAHSLWLDRLADSGGSDTEAALAVAACGQAAAALIKASKHGLPGTLPPLPIAPCLDLDAAAARAAPGQKWQHTVTRCFAVPAPCPAPSFEWKLWAEQVAMPLSASQRASIEAAARDATGKTWRAQAVDLLDLPRQVGCSQAQVAAVLLCSGKDGVSTSVGFRLFGDHVLRVLCAAAE